MRLVRFSRRAKPTWWWVFSVLIAAPAVVLAGLGLWALRAERLDTERRHQEHLRQFARYVDTSLDSLLARLLAELRSVDPRQPVWPGELRELLGEVSIFSLDPDGLLTFPSERVYFGDFGETPADVRGGTAGREPERQALIDLAQAAEARGEMQGAKQYYQRLGQADSSLKYWADYCLARVDLEDGKKIGVRRLLSAMDDSFLDSVTPTGLPVVLLAISETDDGSAGEREWLLPAALQTMENLRQGRWWLSYEERFFYDGVLRERIEKWGQDPGYLPDKKLEALKMFAVRIRASLPYGPDEPLRLPVRSELGESLVLLSPSIQHAGGWTGLVLIPPVLEQILEQITSSLSADQFLSVSIRSFRGNRLWGRGLGSDLIWQSATLRSVREWEVASSGPPPLAWSRQKRLLGYGFTLLLIVMLASGLAMTVRVIGVSGEDHIYHPMLSPDGSQITFSTFDWQTPTKTTLYVMPSEGGKARPLVYSETWNDAGSELWFAPIAWTPDGDSILFVKDPADVRCSPKTGQVAKV